MSNFVIENPVLNSPFLEPDRHFEFGDTGITNTVLPGRRISSYFIPLAAPRKKGALLQRETEWTKDRMEENRTVKRIRERVGRWRQGGYHGATVTTRRILQYGTNAMRVKKPFICQVEALETSVYLIELANLIERGWTGHDEADIERSKNEPR